MDLRAIPWWGWAVGIVGAGALLLRPDRAEAAPSRSGRTAASGRPSAYAHEKLSMLRVRAEGEFATILRVMVPLAWPGMPISAWVGFTASVGSPAEDTAINAQGRLKSGWRFHELGLFQTPAGRPTGLLAPEATAGSNTWLALHSDPLVRRLLRAATGTERDATMVPGAWAHALADQTAVGLTDLRHGYESTKRRLPAAVHPQREDSVWAAAMAFTAFSAGPDVTARSIGRFAAQIAAKPDAERMGAWAQGIAAAVARREPMGAPVHEHGNVAYDWVRTAQKLACGELVAPTLHENAAWYGQSWATPGALQDIVTRAAYG